MMSVVTLEEVHVMTGNVTSDELSQLGCVDLDTGQESTRHYGVSGTCCERHIRVSSKSITITTGSVTFTTKTQ